MAVGQWMRIVDDDSLQRSSHVVSAVGGRAYVFGGELVPREPRDNDVFEISLDDVNGEPIWVTQHVLDAPLLTDEAATSTAKHTIKSISANDGDTTPSPRVGSSSATLRDKMYIFSGRGGQAMAPIEERGQLHCFDPASSSWAVIEPADPSAPYPAARSYHCMTSDNTSTLYVHAGCPTSGRLADLWSFNIDERKWTERAEAPAPQRGGTSIAYVDDKLYRMNGFDGKTEQGGTVDVFDIASGAWSTTSFVADGVAGPEARSVSSLVPVNLNGGKKLLTLFGERDPSSLGHAGAGKMLGDWWVYDIASQKWEQGDGAHETAPAPRGWFDAVALDQRRVVVAGGLSESNERLKDVWILSL